MSGSSFGRIFSLRSFGESHGPAVGCVVDGCPPGLEISAEEINLALAKRRPGQSKVTTQRREPDQVEILSGVYEGKTLGSPIALMVRNIDARSSDYLELTDTFRPGHGDYSYYLKYGYRDPRGGGRSSARETLARVAAGAIAEKYLSTELGIELHAYMAQMGDICAQQLDLDFVDQNPFFFPDPNKIPELEQSIAELRRDGDSIGAQLHVAARKVPAGLGAPVYDKFDADLSKALMSINAVKAVAIGAGFDAVTQKGSEHRDEITPDGFKSNNAGGVLAGITTGQDIFAAIAVKAPASIRIPGASINTEGEPVEVVTKGRHDVCVGIRAVPVARAMLALTLMDHYLLNLTLDR